MTWQPSKPANSAAAISADIRQMWDALQLGWGQGNLVQDPFPQIWSAGDAAAPAHWLVTGTGVAVARTGPGLADTSVHVGPWGAKITAGAAAAGKLTQEILAAAEYDGYLDARPFSLGCFVKCSNSSTARIRIDDGAGTTESAFHTGAGAFELLTLTRSIDAAATKISVEGEVAANGNAVFSGWVLLFGEIPPTAFVWPRVLRGTLRFGKKGTLTTGTDEDRFEFDMPAYIHEVLLSCNTAPTDAAIIVDVNHWDGSAMQSMFTTRPQVAAAATEGRAAPDGTFRYRCFGGMNGGTAKADNQLSFDVDQVGSTVAGDTLRVGVRALQFPSPLKSLLEAA